jgi:hypothetical protein
MKTIIPFEAFFEAKRQFNLDTLYKDTQEPLKDDDVITVYHGFDKSTDALAFAKFGFSGKERAKRIYSYEVGNNPHGLFVTINLDKAKEFAGSGMIMELRVRVSDLEAPVWVGGRSYFVQGEYTSSFETPEQREEQRLANRDKHRSHDMKMVSQSDRPELAQTLFENPERQALVVGDINPNMIKGFWVNDVRRGRRYGGRYEFHPRKQFIAKYYSEDEISTTRLTANGSHKEIDEDYRRREKKLFSPAEDFTIELLKKRILDKLVRRKGRKVQPEKEATEVENMYDIFMDDYLEPKRYYSFSRDYLHTKQIKQLDDMVAKGEL